MNIVATENSIDLESVAKISSIVKFLKLIQKDTFLTLHGNLRKSHEKPNLSKPWAVSSTQSLFNAKIQPSFCRITTISTIDDTIDVRINDHVIYKSRPCKVIDVKGSLIGKRNRQKAIIYVQDMLNSKKNQFIMHTCGHIQTIEKFIPFKCEYEFVSISQGVITYLNTDDELKRFVMNENKQIYKDIDTLYRENEQVLIFLSLMIIPIKEKEKIINVTLLESFRNE